MAEWKAAGWVFSALAVIVVGLTLYLNREQHSTYAYKGCKLNFTYRRHTDATSEEYNTAQRSFGKCLCEQYLKKPDTALARGILS